MRWVWRSPSWAAIGLIRIYQRILSPMLGPCCRFYPSCSRYAVACLEGHGLVRGGWLAIRRIARCNPWHVGGVDLPPSPIRAVAAAAGEGARDAPADAPLKGPLEAPSTW